MTIPVRRLGLPAALTAALLAGLLLTASASPAVAAISTVERQVISWINVDRTALGLKPLRGWGKLYSIAELRAKRMASANVLSHTISGSLARQLSDAGARTYSYGENIASTTYPRGLDAARHIYRMWKNSPVHWGQITSRRFNYVGIGLAYRSSNGRTFAALVFTESPDHTGAGAKVAGAERKGSDVSWSWRAWDVPLQTHMAGLRDVDVQFRTDSGSWRTVRDNTTATSFTATDRAGGHWYGLRVRARDRAGNLGAWTPEQRIWVP